MAPKVDDEGKWDTSAVVELYDPPADHGNIAVGGTESLEDLVRHDPAVSYWQVVPVIAEFFWKEFLPYLRITKHKLLLLYIGLGGVYYLFAQNSIVRIMVILALVLPMILSALFVFKFSRKFVNKRMPPFKAAQDTLMERIKIGRAKRKRDVYDLFLPPTSSKQAGTRDKKFGIIFFPGALVSHTSYATIASQLSDRGILVVVLSLEPIRYDNDTKANKERTLKAMREVVFENDVAIEEWVLSGHSAGANNAIALAAEMQPNINRLLLCGASKKFLSSVSNIDLKVLLVNGSEDGLVNGASDSQTNPPSDNDNEGNKCKTTHVMIQGGNHAGFGHYGPQDNDGKSTISLEQQQAIFVEKTMEFLAGDNISSIAKEKEK